ncbi:MAG: NHL repeat-containing protein [Acidimicrobiales bacterium]
MPALASRLPLGELSAGAGRKVVRGLRRSTGRRMILGLIAAVALLGLLPSFSSPAEAAPGGTIFGVQLGTGIFATSADGAGRHLVVSDPAVDLVSAAPDGSAIAYASQGSGTVVLATAAGTGTATVTAPYGQVGSIAWSPDSATVAFTVCTVPSEPCSLDTVASDGSGLLTIVAATSGGSGVAPSISWGGTGLVADLMGASGAPICEPCGGVAYVVNPNGSVGSPVLPGGVSQANPDGAVAQAVQTGRLAYATGVPPQTGGVQVFDPGGIQPVASYPGFMAPALSPDGSELVVSNGHQVLEAQPGSGASPQPIASFNSYGVTSLSWAGVPSSAGGAGSCSVALSPGAVQGLAADPAGTGYWITDAYGSVSACGSATDYGGSGLVHLNRPVVSISAMPDGGGYRLGAYDGGVLNFGDATAQHGPGTTAVSLSGVALSAPAWSLASTPDGLGYWMATTDGHVYTFGDAGFFGPTKSLHLLAPVVGLVPTPDGRGYWLAAADGGVFAFGDAVFAGSLGGTALPAPIVGMADDPTGGYWLVGSNGTVYPFGGAPALGSVPSGQLSAPIRAMAATPDGRGYWLVDANGHVYVFGDAVYAGSAGQ